MKNPPKLGPKLNQYVKQSVSNLRQNKPMGKSPKLSMGAASKIRTKANQALSGNC